MGFVGQSLLLGIITDYFIIDSPSSADTRNAYLSALGIGLLGLISLVCDGLSFLQGFKISMLTRVMFTSQIYQKVIT